MTRAHTEAPLAIARAHARTTARFTQNLESPAAAGGERLAAAVIGAAQTRRLRRTFAAQISRRADRR